MHILLFPIISNLIAQACKLFIKSNHLKLNWKSFIAYSGMPSGHSATVVSLATIIGLELGINSPIFALSAIFALLTLRDAFGIRQYLGQHGKILNILLKDLENDHVLEKDYPHLLEKIGHTPAQVIAGSAIGFTVSLLGYLMF